MESYTQNSYLDLLIVACGFLIVLMTRFAFSDFEDEKSEMDDTFPPLRERRFSYHFGPGNGGVNAASTRRHSFSYSPNTTQGYTRRRGRRLFGIKHL